MERIRSVFVSYSRLIPGACLELAERALLALELARLRIERALGTHGAVHLRADGQTTRITSVKSERRDTVILFFL